MERWTMEELENTDDISFAISILSQRRNGLNPYSPLSMKLAQTIATLENIKDEKDRYLRRICGIEDTETETEDETNERDYSNVAGDHLYGPAAPNCRHAFEPYFGDSSDGDV